MNRLWNIARFIPAVLAVLLISVSLAVQGGVESAVILGLLVLQAIVLGTPRVARWLGRQLG